MRKLASIQEVVSVSPIEGADRIELVHVLGWQCVAGKGDFKAGDLCVYFEVDSFLPICPEFEILRKNSYKNNEYMGEGFKLRTMKFKGQISQGLVLKPSQLSKLSDMSLTIGLDVTDVLGVKEWEVPEIASSSGTIKSGRPTFIPRTDEIRIQSMPDLLQAFKGIPYYITTKMDGASHSVGYADGLFYTSHNCTIMDDGKSAFVEFVKSSGIAKRIQDYAENNSCQSVVVQGEWCGEGIQKNRLKLNKPSWFVFTVIIDGERQGLEKLKEVCSYIGAEMVPVEETGQDLLEKYASVDALLLRAETGIGFNNTAREGIVIRPIDPVHSDLVSGPLSMKVLNNKYLLKNED